jgi:hypothetical protein
MEWCSPKVETALVTQHRGRLATQVKARPFASSPVTAESDSTQAAMKDFSNRGEDNGTTAWHLNPKIGDLRAAGA